MTGTANAHGLDGTLVEADWPALTLDELRRLFERFPGLRGPIEILTESPRPFSAAGVVKTAAGRVFVKRHARAVRDREGLIEEHCLMQYLRLRGAGVPLVLADAAGESAIVDSDWTYEVHEAAPGVDLYGEALSWTPFRCAQHAEAAGEAMARTHAAAEGFDAPRRKTQPLVASFTIFSAPNPAAAMEKYLTARPALATNARVWACAAQALELLSPFHAQLAPLLEELAPLWTHNDLHASNLLWSNAGCTSSDMTAQSDSGRRVTAIIDFGLADRTSAVHDLAHAIERNIVEWLALVAKPSAPDEVPVHFDHLEALLAGYERVRPLSDAERAALGPMFALCHVEFALSEADYFAGVLGSEEKSAMAYDGWLVGHARWFHSQAGERLLEWIGQWARAGSSR